MKTKGRTKTAAIIAKFLGRIGRRPKLVIDTNLFVAAYWNRKSASARIIKGILEGKYRFFYTAPIKQEAEHILGRIKINKVYREKIKELFKKGKKLRPVEKFGYIKDDYYNNKYLDAANAAKADYIISSDKHLTRLKKFKNIPILIPTQFIKLKN
ncbi:MAG: putative toxin-antitoxin system toxin component, PIN family [Candidatus Omnitrophota bacterium]